MAHSRASPLVALLLSVGLMAGCFGNEGDAGGAKGEGAVPTPGVHPWPAADGSEWPVVGGAALAGPFQKLPTERAFVTAPDGTEINVFVIRPDLPEGVRAPSILWSSPYWGTTQEAGDDPALWDNSWEGEAVPVDLLVENGFAVGIMNLRGSGLSGGCFTLFGPEDWDDTAMVVDWLGEQTWSNGRVGLMGLSYHGTTPWQAAVRNPEHLKTIVTAGMINNVYTFFHTPNGAALAAGPAFGTLIPGVVATVPRMEPGQRIAGEWAPRIPERACPGTIPVLTSLYADSYADVRDETFWGDRRIIRDMPGITASVFLTMGLRDLFSSGHAQEDDPVWGVLPAALPKRMIEGQWGHMFPNFDESWTDTREDWNTGDVLPWLDFWLKGVGDGAPGLGTVQYQDDSLGWHDSTAWPPVEAHMEALHLCGGTLSGSACTGPQGSFVSAVPDGDNVLGVPTEPTVCPSSNPAAQAVAGQSALVFMTEPLAQETLVAGNPFALLEIESDLPGGLVSFYSYEVPGDGSCGDGLRAMGFGAADLRFYEGNYVGRDFPLRTPTPVRIEHTNLVEHIAKGNRLALVVSYGRPDQFEAAPFAPRITIHGGSHILWPVVEGSLGGGSPPIADYPPRPFVPVT
ncbi:MAG TPA: CocE/NonD family hydrolase [Candidatus Thermoplasmatota archaeon]|nr:CocE/NonD family hydrolase [Candidatus Thermoplasmatota archaeon]